MVAAALSLHNKSCAIWGEKAMSDFDDNKKSDGPEEKSKEAVSQENVLKSKAEASACQDGVCILLWKPRPRLA